MEQMEDLSAILASKFAGGERVVAFFDGAAFVGPEWLKRERILVAVESSNGERALFVVLPTRTPPVSFLDLATEKIVAVDDSCDFQIADAPTPKSVLRLAVSARGSKLAFDLNHGTEASEFVSCLFASLERSPPVPRDFSWLRRYAKKSSADADDVSPDMFLAHQNMAQGVAPSALRDNLIKYHMKFKERDYTFLRPFRVFVGTWNVNGQPPPSTMKDWLTSELSPPDIYAIGFQELDLSKEAFLFDFTPREAEWYDTVVKNLDPRGEYKKLACVRLVGMMLVVLIDHRHAGHVSNVHVDTVGTGIMGKMGNKGGVSVRFDLHSTSICFVNSHLAAHVEEFERRNRDYQEICNRTRFNQFSPPLTIKDHDQIFWLGDLNYRITEMDHVTVKRLLKEENIEGVLVADQLRTQHTSENVLAGFTEGPITFRPTYKYDPGTDNWDSSEKERAPAWCDRIFWKGDGITQTSYSSYPRLDVSDHKPVNATFVSQVKVIDSKKYKKVHEDVVKKIDKYENECLPNVTVEPTEIVFDRVRFAEPRTQEICIANTGQVPVRFAFIKKLDEATFCKDWLIVEPDAKDINPGEKCDVRLTVYVHKSSAFKLNLNEDRLYDILVLHLEGGKDIFITVSGTYEKSCFGSSIESLVHWKIPLQQAIAEKFSDLDADNPEDTVYYRKEGYAVPKEIWFLVDHIYLHGLKEENLFQQPGRHSEVLSIRDFLDYGTAPHVPGSVHSVVDALLLFLDSTAEPIIPYNHHYACLNASNNYLQCKQIVMQLPRHKRNVFLYICLFLQEVLNYCADNGTDPKILSLIFGCIFLRESPNNKLPEMHDRKSLETKKKAAFVEHFLTNDQSDLIAY